MNCPICAGMNIKPLESMPAVLHCQDCGYLWNTPSATMTPEYMRSWAGEWGYTPAAARPAQPENCNAPLEYDDRDFAVCLSSRVFAKDIIRNRTDGDIGRRDYRRQQNMDALIASLRR